MKYLLLLVLLSSCSLLDRKPPFTPYANRFNECVQSYLVMDVKPEQAVDICQAALGKRE
jgi:hypothetical protein